MTITTKFDIGEKVFEIISSSYVGRKTCAACSGRGNIPLDNGEKYRCPECFGKGYEEVYGQKEWRLGRDEEDGDFFERPIGQINIEVIGQRPSKTKIRYTRKGTGNCMYEEQCFATEAEAQAECAKRNSIPPRNCDNCKRPESKRGGTYCGKCHGDDYIMFEE